MKVFTKRYLEDNQESLELYIYSPCILIYSYLSTFKCFSCSNVYMHLNALIPLIRLVKSDLLVFVISCLDLTAFLTFKPILRGGRGWKGWGFGVSNVFLSSRKWRNLGQLRKKIYLFFSKKPLFFLINVIMA